MTSSGPSPQRRVFGFWICMALVVGNMIGSGVYLLPATLAPFGWTGVFGWLLTIAGALCLAYVFARLAMAFPEAGGPYAYSRRAFGPFAGFLVAWIYWVSLWIGNVAVATGVVAPLSTIVPGVAAHSAILTCAMIWMLTGINCYGAQLAGRLQFAVTALKFLPLLAVILLALFVIGADGGASLPPLRMEAIAFSGPTGIAAAAALTLWSFLGLESATIPAEKVTDPGRTIARATLAGTAVTGALYLFACSAVALLLPPEQAARSGAPLADFVALYWGADAGRALALFAALTAFGALNGWILLQGEMPWVMAKDGVLPRWLAKTSRRGTPVRAHIVSSLLLTIVLLINQSRSMTELFKFLVLLATTASLVPYLVCSLAALWLRAGRRMSADMSLAAVALLGAVYSAWAIWGAGWEAIAWGGALLVSGLPIYLVMRLNLSGRREALISAAGQMDEERAHG
jgi:APA family basic amino acid/polyamine antiporter